MSTFSYVVVFAWAGYQAATGHPLRAFHVILGLGIYLCLRAFFKWLFGVKDEPKSEK